MSVVMVVDLARVLDESALGKQGAAALQARFAEAKAEHERLNARESSEGKRRAEQSAAAFQNDALAAIEQERARLRSDVLAQARPVIAALMKERKVDLVIDAGACLAVGAHVDVTDDVLQRMG